MVSAPAARTGDLEATAHDDGFGRAPVGLVFRYVFQERLRRVFPAGARLLDLGCGTGEDAVRLALCGFTVSAIDVSPGVIEGARAEAARRGITEERLRFEVLAAEEIGRIGRTFDGVYAGFGALSGADLGEVGRGLGEALSPGARVVVSLTGPCPLPALVRRALTGQGESLRRGVALGEARGQLGRAIRWSGAFALGVLIPGVEQEAWVRSNPQAFGFLAALEGVVRRWPGLRSLGQHVVLEGVRL